MKTATLSALIHTRNEARTIARCIKSCLPIVNEVVVVDMNSADETVAIARQLGARIITVSEKGYVEAARQKGINAVKGTWVLVLDADEKLSASLRKTILNLIKNPQADAFRLPRKNIFLKQWMRHGLQWPDYQVRLFKKNALNWPDIIHTQPEVLGLCETLPATEANAIIHEYRTSIAQTIEKMHIQASHETYYTRQTSVTEKAIIGRMTDDFALRYFNNHGYKDGIRGFILAKIWEYYRFLEFAYYLEQMDFPEILSTTRPRRLQRLQHQVNELEKELARITDSKFFVLFHWYEHLKQLLRPHRL